MAQNYDKILKENLSESIPLLAKTLFDLDIPNTQPIEIKLQHTIEREPDFLAKVISPQSDKKPYAVQFEFQTTNDKTPATMIHRCMLYKALGLFKLNLIFKQYVIYIGNNEPNIDTFYDDGDTQYRIHLVDLKKVDYQVFLNSDKIEEVVFAILADFKNKHPTTLIRNIIKKLQKLASGELELLKHAKQLRILSNLRNLEVQTTKILTTMPILIDITKDSLFQKGQEQGLEQGLEQGDKGRLNITVVNMFLKTVFSNLEIADLAPTSLELVEKLRTEFDKTAIAKVLKRYEKKKDLDKKALKRKAKAIAKELLKMPSLSEYQIAKIIDLSIEEVKNIKAILNKKK